VVSAIMPNGLETFPSPVVTTEADLGSSRLSMLLTWAAVTDAEEYTIYKGENGVFGFIGRTESGVLTFRDTNFAPNYDTVPFQEYEGFDKDAEVQWPPVGEFYKQRPGYAATAADPQKMWFSRPLFFGDMTTSKPAQDDDSIAFRPVGSNRHT